MKVKMIFGAFLLSMVAGMQALADATPQATLDALHKAGAAANQSVFTALLAEDIVFLGFDGGSRLEGLAVRDFITERFASGSAWYYNSSAREIRISGDGSVAWFDEKLESEQLGSGRATGVLIREGDGWKVAQYSLMVALPHAAMATSGALGTQAVAPTSGAANPAPADTQEKRRCMMTSHKTNTRAKC